MELGTYLVTYTPYSDVTKRRTDTVDIRADGHYVLSTITNRFNKTSVPYTGAGYAWEKIK